MSGCLNSNRISDSCAVLWLLHQLNRKESTHLRQSDQHPWTMYCTLLSLLSSPSVVLAISVKFSEFSLQTKNLHIRQIKSQLLAQRKAFSFWGASPPDRPEQRLGPWTPLAEHPPDSQQWCQSIWVSSVSGHPQFCLLYTSPSPRDGLLSRMPSSA